MKIIEDFVRKVTTVYKNGSATEHSYRAALETLLGSLENDVIALNEPKRVACGAPDFIIQRGDIVIGHVEAKDIGVGLRHMKDANKKQQERYRKALPNLIYTNCLDWDFYRNDELIASITIGDYLMGIQPRPDQYPVLEHLLRDFITQRLQTISSPRVLAEMMAGKASLIKDVLRKALKADEDLHTELSGQYRAFSEHLIHDITPEDFADIYAETIAYGMFAARLHDTSPNSFSRQEALELLPKSNPFLRSLFGYLAGPDLDDRIRWIIDDLADVFQAANVHKIMHGFGKLTGQSDPFLHFYETFLAAYNPAKRKARGVWYTPEPVVKFIVRAVDEVLQNDFGLPDGLADTSKVTIDWDTGQADKKGKHIIIKKEVHRVQVLDPATGTGTFLAEVIKHIAPKIKDVAEGMWSSYIERDLIPRLHGFELLMASYAMCHMKLDMILTELGYRPSGSPPRLGVYLTNSLEEGERDVRDLFMAQWLTREAREANTIKLQTPIMCVIGNPPYAGESANKGDWIMGLMDAYKKEPGGKQKLQERNPKWINDDYVKFIRLAEHLIEKNGEGVLGFITNHGYLDNPTFRGMRWQLLNTFDKIYVLDLHGNSKKDEVTPDGTPDKNVFDIQQGVAILIGVKKRALHIGKKPAQATLARVFHADLWGDRAGKYEALISSSLTGELWKELTPPAPHYALTRRDYGQLAIYEQGFALDKFMPIHSNGIVTSRDALTIDKNKQTLWNRVQDFAALPVEEARAKYGLNKDVQDWSVASAQADLNSTMSIENIVPICYRPFDMGWTYYTGTSRGFHCRPRSEVMQHYSRGKNLGLLAPKAIKDRSFAHVFVTQCITEAIFLSGTTGSNAMNFPLYLYPDDYGLDNQRQINFDLPMYQRLQQIAIDEKLGMPNEVQTFDYIYGVLHCPAYREVYGELLKIDYPRIPWPASSKEFWDVSNKGTQLRNLHLMDPTAIGATPYTFRGEGDAVVEKPEFRDDKIWISDNYYFDTVPESVWNFFIGGYKPAYKWLKDRKGCKLSFDDVKHYQRILKVLSETSRIMDTITMH
ncbi:type ISP restriction/modification enzyme [Pseudomonas fluorescens]|uniref:type ISP restriction/modification enzyme n=1 Tax=Pseudomonas fluorescens TaxID=294 RepID=UPI00124094B0|nr:type ISP restriction/modification enzyme [Pseudomonas fluorescens]